MFKLVTYLRLVWLPMQAAGQVSCAPGTLPTSKELPSRESDVCANEELPVKDVLVPTTRLIIIVD